MKLSIKIKSNPLRLLEEAQDFVFWSDHPEKTIFSYLRDDGRVDYCAVGALLKSEYNDPHNLENLQDIRIQDAVQALFFAIPKTERDALIRKIYCPGSITYLYPGDREEVSKRRQRAVYAYNDSLTRKGILCWFDRAIVKIA